MPTFKIVVVVYTFISIQIVISMKYCNTIHINVSKDNVLWIVYVSKYIQYYLFFLPHKTTLDFMCGEHITSLGYNWCYVQSSGGWKSQNNLAHSLKHGYWHKNTWFGPFLWFGHWGPSHRPITIWPWAAVDRAAICQF